MDPLGQLGKATLLIGLALTLVGALMIFGSKIPWLGRLPGDVVIERERMRFYFPFATCIVVSIVLTLLTQLWRR